MNHRVLLLARDWVGQAVDRYLQSRGDAVIRSVGACDDERPDWLITVYWPELVPEELIACAKQGTVNFHPSLLPLNRGWHPYVHNILEGSPAGVTLHELAKKADSGRVWAQSEVKVLPWDTAWTLRHRLGDALIMLFRKTWPEIADGIVRPTPQDEGKATYHKRSEVLGDHPFDLDAPTTMREALRTLRAYSYGSMGYACYDEGGRRIYVKAELGPTPRCQGDDR